MNCYDLATIDIDSRQDLAEGSGAAPLLLERIRPGQLYDFQFEK